MSSSGHELISRSSDSFGKGMPYTSSSDDLNLKENNEFQMDEFSTVFNHNTADLKAVSLETPNVATLAPPEKNIIVRDSKFWLIFLSLCVCSFLSALDLTAVSTVLPEMANEFQSNQYSYVGSAYALTSCAFIPWVGALAGIFGRKYTMLSAISFFAIGSAVTGSAPSMSVVIIGRALQGVGGGGILVMSEIVVVDMVGLAQRGSYFGIIGSVWGLSSAIGPAIGGAFSNIGRWRWLFYMNLPICAAAAILVICFMNLKTPERTWAEKRALMDYTNILFVLSATSTILGLTWAGSSYSWNSAAVLVPLIFGIAGILLFIFIEKNYVSNPTVPFDILRHPTSLLGYFTNTLHGIVVMLAVYYFTVWFQSVKNASPLQAAVNLFTLSFTIAPFAIIGGAYISLKSNYKIPNLVGWGFTLLGFSLSTLLDASSGKAPYTIYTLFIGIGVGINYSAINFPILSPLKTQQQPHAVAFLGFSRAFGQVIGITIGGTILNNGLGTYLPAQFLAGLPGGQLSNNAYSAVPLIPYLPEPLQEQVHIAFVNSLRTVWVVGAIISGIGFLSALCMQEINMKNELNADWGIERDEGKEKDVERITMN